MFQLLWVTHSLLSLVELQLYTWNSLGMSTASESSVGAFHQNQNHGTKCFCLSNQVADPNSSQTSVSPDNKKTIQHLQVPILDLIRPNQVSTDSSHTKKGKRYPGGLTMTIHLTSPALEPWKRSATCLGTRQQNVVLPLLPRRPRRRNGRHHCGNPQKPWKPP